VGIPNGATPTWGKLGLCSTMDFIGLSVSYGQVDPKRDTTRARIIGKDKMTSYGRWTDEALYMLPLKMGPIVALELNYRLFIEQSAPLAIVAASLDRRELATVRVGLKNDLFVAYSTGRLPFDKISDHVVALGFSYKLQ
jgi:hypothetical protein